MQNILLLFAKLLNFWDRTWDVKNTENTRIPNLSGRLNGSWTIDCEYGDKSKLWECFQVWTL